MSLTRHWTPVAYKGPFTVAANCCVQPNGTEALEGVTTTVSGPDVMVTCAELDVFVSAWLTATTVTVPDWGTTAGAV
jgi:hypothetical protein